MQDRMQSGSRLLDLVYQGIFSTLFPLFLFAARAFCRRERAHEIADAVANGFMRLRPKYLDAVRANMARILDLPPAHPRVDAAARDMVRRHAQAWVDFFHYGQRDPGEALANFASLRGLEHMDAALAQGKGAIILTAHVGCYELGGLLLRGTGHRLHMVYKPDRFEAVERLRTRIRTQGGVVGIPVGGGGLSTLPLLKVLGEGGLAGMQGDRDFNLNGLPIPFFGREVHFPRGPWELAAMTGAPILCAFFHSDADGRFHARFEEPILITGARGQRRAAIEEGMRRYAAYLEDLVRRYPDQWYCFYPFWDDPLRQAARKDAAGPSRPETADAP